MHTNSWQQFQFPCLVPIFPVSTVPYGYFFDHNNTNYLWSMCQNEEPVSKILNRLETHLTYVELYNPDIFAQLFASIFFVQNLIMLIAKEYGYTQLQFLLKEDILKASSDII